MKTMTILRAALGLMLLGTLLPAAAQTPSAAAAPAAAPALSAALSLQANADFLAANAKKPGVFRRPSGLQFKILRNGFGKRPGNTDTVEVYYAGRLIDGTMFDGTSPGLPASFPVNKVVPGWVEALQLMREGDHWLIWVPAHLGYGVRGAPGGSVPPNQTLAFDIQLISSTPAPKRGDKDYRPEPGDKDEEQP